MISANTITRSMNIAARKFDVDRMVFWRINPWLGMLVCVLIVGCLEGCGDSEKDLVSAIDAFAKSCEGSLSGEFSAGSYNKTLTLKCDHMTFKERSK